LALLLLAGALATALIAARIEARYPPKGRFVEVAGGRLHVLEAGPEHGDPQGTVVLIHGASANAAELMTALGPRLAARYRVLAFDRPGHGWSDRVGGADAASPVRQAAVIAEALRRLGVTRAVVVGHSWAGSLVADLALDHTDVAGAILLLAPVTHPWPGGKVAWYYGPAASVPGWLFTRTLTTPVGLAFLKPIVAAVFAPQSPPADYVEAAQVPLVLRPAAFRANARDVAGLYAAVAAQSRRYRDIRVPAAVVAGDADDIVTTSIHAVAFAREVPGARLTILPGVGHMPHQVAADAVVAELDRLVRNAQAVDHVAR
jgi:pimeloyl-ACP methyl ester carboxylesterase